MIRVLAREQWRFQRGYIVWAAAIVAAAVGFATFATLSAATQGALDRYASRVALLEAPYGSVVVLTDSGPEVPADVDYGVRLSTVGVNDLMTTANEAGAGATAHLWVQGDIVPGSSWEPAGPAAGWHTIYAVWGDVDWDTILAEGAAPGANGIVLPTPTARELGVGVGDVVTIGHSVSTDPDSWRFVPDASLTVTGLAYETSIDGWDGPAYVSPDQLDALATMWTASHPADQSWPLQATVSWNHPSSVLATSLGENDAYEPRTFGSTAALPWLLAGLFTVGSIVTAFTLGRAQAQARVRWVATARALGAHRRHLLGVAGLEWVAVAAAGALVGVLGGGVFATAAHALRMSRMDAAPPVDVSVPAFAVALMAALAALLATAVVAVPTVLALRVPPTAALKEGPVADAVSVSRRVKFWPVALLFVVTWSATAAIGLSDADGLTVWGGFFGLAAGITGIAVLVESCRALIRVTARRLGSSRRPWAVHASMTMSGHPQQAAALAIVQALVMTGVGGAVVTRELNTWSVGAYNGTPFSVRFWIDDLRLFLDVAIPAPLSTTSVMVLLVAAQALVVAIAASSRRVASPETATAGALGLPSHSVRRGDAAAQLLAQAHGAWTGLIAGGVGIGGIWLTTVGYPDVVFVENDLAGTPLEQIRLRLLAIAMIAVVSLAIAGLVAGGTSVLGQVRDRLTPGRPVQA